MFVFMVLSSLKRDFLGHPLFCKICMERFGVGVAFKPLQ
jgi:hypothetical protein